jgi:hypothetical protein
MVRSISRIVLLCGLLTLAATAGGGCQRGPTWNLAPVEGTVLKDGRPLHGIEVVFLPDADTVGPQSSGITDEVGHYRLRTDGGDDGAAVGSHRVCIHDTHRAPLSLSRLPKKAANAKAFPKEGVFLKEAASASPRVPSSYGRPNETPLRVNVRSSPQVIDLDVNSPPHRRGE